jgi:hypothetical protein
MTVLTHPTIAAPLTNPGSETIAAPPTDRQTIVRH